MLEPLIDQLAAAEPASAELAAADRRAFDLAMAVSLGATIDHWPAVRRIIGRAAGQPGQGAALAMTLATCSRATEVDDIHLRSCTTPGSVVVPAALACATLGAPAGRVRAAIVSGYEAVVSLGELLGGPALLAQGIWPTRAVAPVGAALTAAAALGLGAAETRAAAALAAGARLTGVLPEPGRELSAGLAVFAGVTSAIAAAEGVRGSARLLADWPLVASAGQLAAALPASGRGRAAVLDTCVKPFCSARQALAATALLRGVAAAEPELSTRVRAVTVGVPGQHVAMVDRRQIASRLDAITSLPFSIALALDAPGSLDDVRRLTRPADGRSRQLMDCVTVVADGDMQAAFPARWGASVRMILPDGERTWRVDGVPGERDNSWAALEEKAGRLFGRAGLSQRHADELRQLATGGAHPVELAAVLAEVSSGARTPAAALHGPNGPG